ncbi:hypothetical protein PWYN_11475 [Paenibacillus wynnii]|uniref:Uncharacterized protein n=1 Tax=Paenibacillus wynnii TaxID=268407 RepID=A0A098MBG0_9BACL|nr:hypothetical protein PWYN_11475 [Paenibacillus wynnii]
MTRHGTMLLFSLFKTDNEWYEPAEAGLSFLLSLWGRKGRDIQSDIKFAFEKQEKSTIRIELLA